MVVPEAPAVPQLAPSPRRWPWAVGAVAAVAAGVLVGMVAFGDRPPGMAAEAGVATPATTVPPSEQIVPELPPELGGPQAAPGDPLGDLGDLGDLAGRLEEFFGGDFLDELRRQFEGIIPEGGVTPPPSDDFGFSLDGIVSVPEPPPGYTITSNNLGLSPTGVEQTLVLSGPDGDVVITAVRGPAPADPLDGERVAVRGTTGVLGEVDGRPTLRWAESDLVTVTIEAPEPLGADGLVSLAESLEVAP